MMKKLMFIVLVMAVLAGSALAAPDGPYRLVFVTSTNLGVPAAWDTATSMDGVNAYVQSLATGAGLPGVAWTAIASTSYLDARDNTNTNPTLADDALGNGTGVPIYLVDGTTMVALNNADLWDGEIANNINLNENGDAQGAWPHTGTYLDGTVSDPAIDPTYGRGFDDPALIAQGFNGDPTQWIFRINTQRPPLISQDPKAANNIYAMSEIIPEPATMVLLGLGGLTLLRRRRNG